MSFDRGAFSSLTFERCARGFTLAAYNLSRDCRATFAFDRIEDLAAWLVEQYAQGTEAGTAKTVQQGLVHDGPVGETDAPKGRLS